MIRRVTAFCLALFFILSAAPVGAAEETLEPNDPATENPVIVTEVYPDAPSSVTEKDPVLGEFIELHNTTSEAVSLNGFSLEIVTIGSGTVYTVDLTGKTLAPLEYLDIRDLDSSVNFSLSNDSATVELKYTVGTLVLTLSSLTYTALISGFSWSYIGNEWVAGLPTPAAENQALPAEEPEDEPPASPACDITNVFINEILPNPAGSDAAGGEFVELHNTGSGPVSLAGCQIKTDKLPELTLPDITLGPGGYYAVGLSDDLLNSGGGVWFITKTTEEIVEYSALGDDEAWALLGGKWQLTELSTPGAANLPTPEKPQAEDEGPEPCPPGKFRNPETNRCKNLSETAGSLLPCQPGQERNPLTNRCRKTSSTGSSRAPCGPGEERNPDTNRCRKVATGVAGAATFSTNTPAELHDGFLVIVALLAIAYGFYEYRLDIANQLSKLRRKP
jgi:hypothetical protein